MYTPAFEGLTVPALAIDLGERGLRALVHAPVPARGADSLSRAQGPWMLSLPYAPPAEQLAALWESGEILAPEVDPARAPALCRLLPTAPSPARPKIVLVCASASSHALEAVWQRRFAARASDGVTPGDLLAPAPSPERLRLSAIRSIIEDPLTDSFSASILGMLSRPAIAGRGFREGIVLAEMGNTRTRAALAFRNRIFGVLDLPAVRQSGVPELMRHLESFRLGWLPSETARALGGYSCVAPQLPAEAEGFHPLYASGPRASMLAGLGQIAGTHVDAVMNRCWGLLYGYSNFAQGAS